MIVGVPLLKMTIDPLTAALFTERGTPICGPLQTLYREDVCFEIVIIPGSGYAFTCAAVAVFLLTGFDGSFTHKFMHRQLFPDDVPPPRAPECLRRWCRKRKSKRASISTAPQAAVDMGLASPLTM